MPGEREKTDNMRIVTKQWSQLAAGYLEAVKLERQLGTQWKTPLADRDQRRAAQLAAEKKTLNLWRWVLIGSALATLTVVLACLSLPLALLAGVRYWQTRKRIQALEQKPILNLISCWWAGLAADGPAEEAKDGDAGETDLLRRLDVQLPDSYLAIRGIPVARSLDADVLLLGPTGLWILESKFWSGQISYREGVWHRRKQYYAPGGTLMQEDEVIDKAFDRQWLREREQLEKTLSLRLARRASGLTRLIKGGLVFTHPKATLAIDRSCPVECGTIAHWVRRITTAPPDPQLSAEVQLEVLDALLSFADSFEVTTSRSAVEMARSLQRQANPTS